MGELHRQAKLLLLSYAIIGGSICSAPAYAADEESKVPAPIDANPSSECEPNLTKSPRRRAKAATAASPAKAHALTPEKMIPVASTRRASKTNPWTLDSFFETDPEKNLALQHPFVLANAAEKAYALVMHAPARTAKDPMYGVQPVTIYPTLTGELKELRSKRRVIGQEEPVHKFVQSLYSAARGDRIGKTPGFPGPAGTGKTELFYVIDELARTLGRENKYKQFSYRFKGLSRIPKLRKLTSFIPGPDGKPVPMDDYFNPDMPRSPFTLLRSDMQQKILAELPRQIRSKWGVLITKGWRDPEPKTREILLRIFEHEYPDLEQGLMTVEDIPDHEYLEILNRYVVIVPKDIVRPPTLEAKIVESQQENPNMASLFTTPDMARLPEYKLHSELSVNYTGEVFQQDGGLLMLNELYRNDPSLLNSFLETIQNHTVQGDVGRRVKLDVFPVWNSNDESIAEAQEKGAVKALIDRTEPTPMRLLLPPKQIEAVIPFQVGSHMYRMRPLNNIDGKLEILPFEHAAVYPAVNEWGETKSAQGRYALYYHVDGTDYLIAPYTLNYISWIAAATRTVVEKTQIERFTDSLDLVGGSNVLYNPIARVKAMIGDLTVDHVHRGTLFRLAKMTKEGMKGISSRDVETWMKEVHTLAQQSGKNVITPRLANQALVNLLESGGIDPGGDKMRIYWNQIRELVAQEILLPKMMNDVRTIVSGEGNKADRIYDSIIEELLLESEAEPGQDLAVLGVNETRRNRVKEIYKAKTGREFTTSLITRLLSESNPTGAPRRHQELLAAVHEMLAETETFTSDHIESLDRAFRGADEDPIMRQKLSDITEKLTAYGYDRPSFEEAVKLVAQLDADKRRRAKRLRPQ